LDFDAKYKFHQVPKTIQDQKDKIRLQKEEEQKRKSQKFSFSVYQSGRKRNLQNN
jgi:hypothetical protein